VIPREERHRLACLLAGPPLVVLAGPVFVPRPYRSVLETALREPPFLAVLLALLGSILFTAGVSLVAGLRRKAPGGFAYGVPAVTSSLVAASFAGIVLYAFVHDSHVPAYAVAGAIPSALSLYPLLRGFRRSGFERWCQLVAGAWLAEGGLVLTICFSSRSRISLQAQDAWLVAFALSFSLSALAWALFPRKAPAPRP
jgi:hypothetical protein